MGYEYCLCSLFFEDDVDYVVLVRPPTMNPSHLCMGRDLIMRGPTGSWGERYDCISNRPLLWITGPSPQDTFDHLLGTIAAYCGVHRYDVDDVVLVRPSTINPSILGMGCDLMSLPFS